MVDEPSSLGEAVMLGAGSIEHRELIYYTVSKSTTFEPPRAGPRVPVNRNPQPANRDTCARVELINVGDLTVLKCLTLTTEQQ